VLTEKCKVMSNYVKGIRKGSHDSRLEIWHPYRSWEARNFKFGMQIYHKECYQTDAKLGQRGHEGGHRTHFWNFGTPCISRERLKVETSNLIGRCKMPYT